MALALASRLAEAVDGLVQDENQAGQRSEERRDVVQQRHQRPPLRVVLANGASEDRSVKRLRSFGMPGGIEKARSRNGLGSGITVPGTVHATGAIARSSADTLTLGVANARREDETPR